MEDIRIGLGITPEDELYSQIYDADGNLTIIGAYLVVSFGIELVRLVCKNFREIVEANGIGGVDNGNIY